MRNLHDTFSAFTDKVSMATGSFWTFCLAVILVVVWALSGFLLNFSTTWNFIANTSTTVLTFLMVFVIQHAQNKENRAVQLKLNELIASTKGASNRLIDAEDLTESELKYLHKRYQALGESAKLLEPGAKTTIDKDEV